MGEIDDLYFIVGKGLIDREKRLKKGSIVDHGEVYNI